MIINKNSMYCPKKPSPKPPVVNQPLIRPQNPNQQNNFNKNPIPNQPPLSRPPSFNQIIQNQQQRPNPNQRQVLVPDQIIKANPLAFNDYEDISENELINPLDFFFGKGFFDELFNENTLKELSKTNDVNHEKWTKVDKDTNSVIHFESFSICSKDNKHHKMKKHR